MESIHICKSCKILNEHLTVSKEKLNTFWTAFFVGKLWCIMRLLQLKIKLMLGKQKSIQKALVVLFSNPLPLSAKCNSACLEHFQLIV